MAVQMNTGYNLKANLRPLVEKKFITLSAGKALISSRMRFKSKIFPSIKLLLSQVSNPKIYEEEEGIFSKSLDVDLLKTANRAGLIFAYAKDFNSCMLLTKKECNKILKGKRPSPSDLLIFSIERQMEIAEGRSATFEGMKKIGIDGFIVDEPGRWYSRSFISNSYLGTHNRRKFVSYQAFRAKQFIPFKLGGDVRRYHPYLHSFQNIKNNGFLPYIIEVIPSNPDRIISASK